MSLSYVFHPYCDFVFDPKSFSVGYIIMILKNNLLNNNFLEHIFKKLIAVCYNTLKPEDTTDIFRRSSQQFFFSSTSPLLSPQYIMKLKQ